jgi:hypothetical protein
MDHYIICSPFSGTRTSSISAVMCPAPRDSEQMVGEALRGVSADGWWRGGTALYRHRRRRMHRLYLRTTQRIPERALYRALSIFPTLTLPAGLGNQTDYW